jgi:hypothetical protein
MYLDSFCPVSLNIDLRVRHLLFDREREREREREGGRGGERERESARESH